MHGWRQANKVEDRARRCVCVCVETSKMAQKMMGKSDEEKANLENDYKGEGWEETKGRTLWKFEVGQKRN